MCSSVVEHLPNRYRALNLSVAFPPTHTHTHSEGKYTQCIQNSVSGVFLTEGGSHLIETKTSSPQGEAKMSITSDEVNFLVYRYLQESGNQACFSEGSSF